MVKKYFAFVTKVFGADFNCICACASRKNYEVIRAR